MSIDTTTEYRLLLTAREAARLLSVSERTLYDLTVPRGPIPCVKIGSRGVRYARAALQAFARGGCGAATGVQEDQQP